MKVIAYCTVTKTSERPFPGSQPIADRKGTVCVISCHELRACPYWQHAFASQHKDHRYYDLINETIHPEFKYLYFVLKDATGKIRAIQPFFIIDQDILAGAPWILEPSATGLCEPDLHVFAKLFEDRLERGLEAQALSGREIGGDDDVLNFFVGHLVDVDLTRQPAS